MRRTFITLAVVLASSLPALAQSTPPANHDAKTPAVNTHNGSANPGAPVAGANSFTEGQAKSQIEAKGYTAVSELKKDKDGVWRGQAQKSGAAIAVSVDFQGNVVAK